MERRQFLQIGAVTVCGALIPKVSTPEIVLNRTKKEALRAQEKGSITDALHTASALLAPYLSLIPSENRLREFEATIGPEFKDEKARIAVQKFFDSLHARTGVGVQQNLNEMLTTLRGEMTDDQIEEHLKRIMHITPQLKLLAWSPALLGVITANVKAMLLNMLAISVTRLQLAQKYYQVIRKND
jgi:hypothetical protein